MDDRDYLDDGKERDWMIEMESLILTTPFIATIFYVSVGLYHLLCTTNQIVIIIQVQLKLNL